MTATPALRLRLAALAFLAEAVHLGWEALHGGIQTHHLLQRADLPAVSNAWGLLVLPLLAAWAAGRWPADRAATRERGWVMLGLAVPWLVALAMSWSMAQELSGVTELLFMGLLAAAVVLPGYRPECLLGFVLGMSWTIGAVLPTVIGGLIAGVSWTLRHLAGWAWRRVGPA